MSSQETSLINILVVDDRPENLIALEAVLENPAYRIVTAQSGQEALHRLLKYKFAVVLLDLIMPGMDGLEVAEYIRNRESTRTVPIIFLTAAGGENIRSRTYAAGAVDTLLKPVDPETVRAKVRVFVDIHRRVEAERQDAAVRDQERLANAAALRRSEAIFEATFREAVVGIGHLDQRGRWIRVNPRLCDIVGRQAEDLLGQRFDALAEDAKTARQDEIFECLGAGALPSHCGEYRLRHAQGQTVWADVKLSAIGVLDQAPHEHTVVCIVEDISGRRRREDCQALLIRLSEVLLSTLDERQAAEAVVDGVASTLGDWCVFEKLGTDAPAEIFVKHKNHAIADLAQGYAQDAAAQAPFLVPALAQLTGCSNHGVDTWLASDQTRARRFFELLDASSMMAVRVDIRRECIGILIVGRDHPAYRSDELSVFEDLAQRIALAIENARLHSKAQRAIALRDEFMCIASHELRTPLTPLLLQLQRLRMSTRPGSVSLSPARVERIAKLTEAQVQRLVALVDELLDVSRISSGRFELHRENIDLTEAVNDVAQRFAEKLDEAQCPLHIEADVPVVGSWDPLRIEQVIVNLLGNAIKYGGGQAILLRVGHDAHNAYFVVEDHGIGIPPEKLATIFGRFERAVSSRNFSGLGLGLYIVQQILTAHGGTIEVQSAPQEGCTFKVSLPLQPSAIDTASTAPLPQTTNENSRGKPGAYL